MARRPTSFFTKGGLFSPRLVTKIAQEDPTVLKKDSGDISGSLIGQSSFQFDAPGAPFKSTQQIPIDWSDFVNHTFFNSAESKVNVTFDTVINYFPFDGNQGDLDAFMENLTGFEKWLFDKWPKHVGWLFFSGSTLATPQEGTYAKIKDVAGVLYPSLSTRRDGATVLDPGTKSFSLEFYIHVPEEATDDMVVLQKIKKKSSGNFDGYTVCLKSATASENPWLFFMISSGSTAQKVKMRVQRGGFRHVACVYDRQTTDIPSMKLYYSGNLIASSSNSLAMGSFAGGAADLLVGSGSKHAIFGFTPRMTLSGALDELKLFTGLRTQKQIKTEMSTSVEPSSALKGYFKFNEATGSYTNNNIILDSSGNSLHSRVENFSHLQRNKRDLVRPIIYEYLSKNPVLFPAQPDVVALNTDLMYSASLYDANNPNLITKLIPPHYLIEASANEGYDDEYAGRGDAYSFIKDFPGGGKMGSPQIIASLLFTWAKFFDEIKIYLDQFGDLLKMDYDSESTVSDQMLMFFANHYGFDLPTNFANASISQFHFGKNLNYEPSLSAKTLRKIQDEIWRRMLTNLNHIIRSKGTIHGIKALLRAAGINPDNNFRFREFGGSRTITTDDSRRKLTQISKMLSLTGSKSSIRSPFLSGSRVTVGWPTPQGTFVKTPAAIRDFGLHGVSNRPSDGLFTTASWTYEGIYSFANFISDTPPTQSLMRMYVTGTHASTNTGDGGCIVNLVACGTGSGQYESGSLNLFVRSGIGASDPTLEMTVRGVNIFDGNKWHVTAGRDIGSVTGSFISASYFIRAGRQNAGTIEEYYYTSSYFKSADAMSDTLSTVSSTYNSSGSYFIVGSSSFSNTSGNRFLNSTSKVKNALARQSTTAGEVARIRFWTKALTQKETKEHLKNFKSLGVDNPLVNFNFDTVVTGAFERLRIDAAIDQMVTKSDGHGKIAIFDFSQNKMHLSGTLFQPAVRVIHPRYFSYSILDPKWDERSAENKIRVQGFQKDINIEQFNALKAPVRNIRPDIATFDDTRFSIEVSAVRALNEDIVLIMSSLDFFDEAIGAPELQFAVSYPELEKLRRIYFNRLDGKLNFKTLFEFFKWFDDSLSLMIERLIPRHTNFLGINFVIESHLLERNKNAYSSQASVYLGEEDRRQLQTDLLLKQIVITLKRM